MTTIAETVLAAFAAIPPVYTDQPHEDFPDWGSARRAAEQRRIDAHQGQWWHAGGYVFPDGSVLRAEEAAPGAPSTWRALSPAEAEAITTRTAQHEAHFGVRVPQGPAEVEIFREFIEGRLAWWRDRGVGFSVGRKHNDGRFPLRAYWRGTPDRPGRDDGAWLLDAVRDSLAGGALHQPRGADAIDGVAWVTASEHRRNGEDVVDIDVWWSFPAQPGLAYDHEDSNTSGARPSLAIEWEPHG